MPQYHVFVDKRLAEQHNINLGDISSVDELFYFAQEIVGDTEFFYPFPIDEDLDEIDFYKELSNDSNYERLTVIGE